MPDRKLTDADVEALADALKEKVMNDLYSNLGKGVWALFQKALIAVVVAVAAYGAFKGIK